MWYAFEENVERDTWDRMIILTTVRESYSNEKVIPICEPRVYPEKVSLSFRCDVCRLQGKCVHHYYGLKGIVTLQC